MSTESNRVWDHAKVSITVLGYALLTLFMLFLTYMTYERGGELADWKSIVTLGALAMMCFITGWLTLTAWRDR